MLKNYCYLNTGLTIIYNGEKYFSDNGLKDLLEENISGRPWFIRSFTLIGEDIEVAITHSKSQYSEEYHSFVNGQNTTQGGTHLGAFREAIVKTIREFYNKGLSLQISGNRLSARSASKSWSRFLNRRPKPNWVRPIWVRICLRYVRSSTISSRTKLDNFLHKNPETADCFCARSCRRKANGKNFPEFRKLAKDRAKKASLHNKKLRDCRVHLTDSKNPRKLGKHAFHHRRRFGFGLDHEIT
jgi:topoisomerase-4 subunit B